MGGSTSLEEFFPVSGCYRFRKTNKDYELATTNTTKTLNVFFLL
jgi:hypothetical protein